MAKLEGKAGLIGPEWFSLKPLKNQQEGMDSIEYLFEFWPGPDGSTFSRIYGVPDWLMHHNDAWLLARIFTESSVLTEATISIDLWGTGGRSHAYMYKHTDSLHAILWGNKRRKGVAVRLFVCAGDDPTIFRTFFIQTTIAQAMRFGLELEREIIEASPIWSKENERSANE